MPNVFVWRGLRFFFYSNERNEPPHIHVRGRGCETKIWLSDLAIARNRGFAEHELRDILTQVRLHRTRLLEAWGSILDTDLEIAHVTGARVTASHVVAMLADGREIATPLSWYPTLVAATPEARGKLEISPFGIHWPDLDEDLSVEGMLRGERSATAAA